MFEQQRHASGIEQQPLQELLPRRRRHFLPGQPQQPQAFVLVPQQRIGGPHVHHHDQDLAAPRLARLLLEQLPQLLAALGVPEQLIAAAAGHQGLQVFAVREVVFLVGHQLQGQGRAAVVGQQLPGDLRAHQRPQQPPASPRIALRCGQLQQPVETPLLAQHGDGQRVVDQPLVQAVAGHRLDLLPGELDQLPNPPLAGQELSRPRGRQHELQPVSARRPLGLQLHQLQDEVQLAAFQQQRQGRQVLKGDGQQLPPASVGRLPFDEFADRRQLALRHQPLQHQLGERQLYQHRPPPRLVAVAAHGGDQLGQGRHVPKPRDRGRLLQQQHQQLPPVGRIRLQPDQPCHQIELAAAGQFPKGRLTIQVVAIAETADQPPDGLRNSGQDPVAEIIQDLPGTGRVSRSGSARAARNADSTAGPCRQRNSEAC